MSAADKYRHEPHRPLSAGPTPRPELVQYHTAWSWPPDSMDFMKSLLLFFDGVAWLLPAEQRDQMLNDDPVLAEPLFSTGLLHNFEPEAWMTQEIAEEIRRAARVAARYADFGSVETLIPAHFINHGEDVNTIIDELIADKVIAARDTRGLVRLPHEILSAIMTVVALGARAMVTGFDLQLASEPGNYVIGPLSLLLALDALGAPNERTVITAPYLPWMNTYESGRGITWPPNGYVPLALASDLQDVGINLTGVPLDEVLDYRARHGVDYRAYRHALRQYATTLAAATPEDRERLAYERTEEIGDHAAALRAARRSFARPAAAFCLTVAGATWTLVSGDPVGGILAALSAASGLTVPAAPASAYTYLFTALADLNRQE